MNRDAAHKPAHEIRDVHTGYVWLVALGTVICCLLIGIAVLLMLEHLQHREQFADARPHDYAPIPAASPFPEPRLQVSPESDLAAFRAREDAELNTYGWIDKNAGVIRIPIDRAMDLIAQRGLPVEGQPGAPAPSRTTLDLQQARPLERETPAP